MFFPRRPADRGVHHVAPTDITDDRILTAEELSLQNELNIIPLANSRKTGFLDVEELILENRGVNSLTIKATLTSGLLDNINLDTSLELESVFETGESTSSEYFYALVFAARVGAEIDNSLGTFSRQYEGSTITETRENTQRLRVFHLIVSSYTELSSQAFGSAIAIPDDGTHHSQMGSVEVDAGSGAPLTGFTIANYKAYADDTELVSGTYTIILDTITLAKICTVHHRQASVEQGFQYEQGSVNLEQSFQLTALPVDTAPFLDDLMKGFPLAGGTVNTTVLNLIQGATNTGTTPHPGMTSNSPNGSVAIGNDQRVFFSNEKRLQQNSIQYEDAEALPDGKIKVSATNNTNAPSGTRFSSNYQDHHVYDLDGNSLDVLGSFTDLGNETKVSWIAGQNAQVQSGQKLVFQPGLVYPAGSGFNVPFSNLNAAYLNGEKLDSSALLNGRLDDLESYQEPPSVTDGAFFVVWGTERSALHYIYKKITVTADAAGTVIVPDTEKGCFAFINGVSGRLDAPVEKNLSSNASYDALIYYPPRSTNEIWQFEVSYVPYQGMGIEGLPFLNNSKIVSEPQFFTHSQGGGLSVHSSDSSLEHSPIGFHLPKGSSQYPSYSINHPVQLKGESYPGPLSLRQISPLHGQGVRMPQEGSTIFATISGAHEDQSLNVWLGDEYLNTYGYRTPYFQNETAYFQHVCSFLVEKDGIRAMVVITHNEIGNKDNVFDFAEGAAIDVFVAQKATASMSASLVSSIQI